MVAASNRHGGENSGHQESGLPREVWVGNNIQIENVRYRQQADAETVTNWSEIPEPSQLAESALCESIGLSGTQRVEQAGCDLRVWQIIAPSYRKDEIVGYRFLRMNDVTGVFTDLLEEI